MMKSIKSLRICAATVASILVPTLCTNSGLSKEEKSVAKAIVYTMDIDEKEVVSTTTSTNTTTSTTTTTTTIVTTTEPVDIYKHIRNLEQLKRIH